jgi:hypothetical protein
MAYTLIGVYDNYSDAESALTDLLSRGFPRHKLHLGLIEDTPLGREAALQKLEQADDQSTNRLTLPEFFRTLFGNDPDSDRDIYLEAVRRGSYVLTVDAENDQQAHQAIDTMASHHPVNIDERSSEWRNRGWSHFDPTAEAMTQGEVDLERSLYAEEKPTLPIQQVQGDPVKDMGAQPGTDIPILRNEAQRLGVRLIQRGF